MTTIKMKWIFEEQLHFVAEERWKPSQSCSKFQGKVKWHCLLLLSAIIRHHQFSSPTLYYSTDFCYLVTAQERTGSARQWYTRRTAPFPLARNVLYWAHHDIGMILPSACYVGYSISALAVQEAQKAKHPSYYQLYRQQLSEQAWPSAESFYFEDFRETWTRKFHHRDFCFLKSQWCVRRAPLTSLLNLERDLRLPSFGCLTDVYIS